MEVCVVFVAYIKEMGAMLEKYNGSLTFNSLTATLARVKTVMLFDNLMDHVKHILFVFCAKPDN
jgi:hypothetical protein